MGSPEYWAGDVTAMKSPGSGADEAVSQSLCFLRMPGHCAGVVSLGALRGLDEASAILRRLLSPGEPHSLARFPRVSFSFPSH